MHPHPDPQLSSELGLDSTEWSGFIVDQELAARQRVERDAKHNCIEIPRLRLAGSVMLLSVIALHDWVVRDQASLEGLLWLAAVFGIYNLVSIQFLRRFYSSDARLSLGDVFLFVDLFVLVAPTVWFTGGPESWLLFLPYIRVAEHAYRGPKFCLLCSHLGLLALVAIMALWYLLQPAALPVESVSVKVATMHAIALYVSLASIPAASIRARSRNAVRIAREVIRALRLKSTELQVAREEAEEANAAKSMFMANVSHEIRTPMNAILGLTELTLESELDEDQRTSLSLVRNAADGLLHLINELLDYAKLEAGRVELELLPFDLIELLDSTVRTQQFLAKSKNVELRYRFSAGLPAVVVGDAGRLRQILTNLLGNALKFTEDGWVELEVTGSASDSSAQLTFSVRDSGIGIPAEKLDVIFESFSQADVSTTRRFGGTGLGLSISSEYVARMGSRIEVVSEEGVGSEFSFVITLAIPQEGAAHGESSSGEIHQESTELRVLLVEDNLVNQRVAERRLVSMGHTVELAGDGREAQELWAPGKFDIVLMDLHMPNVDGYLAAAAIRERESGLDVDRTPIVALSAGVLESEAAWGGPSIFDDALLKPLDLKRLSEVLARAGQLKQARGEATRRSA